MKKFSRIVLLLSISAFSLLACQSPVQEKSITLAEEKLAKVEMKVDGMVCAMGCAKFIQDKVAEKEGVKDSKVDFESGIAYFTFNENALSAEDLEKFIDEIHDGQYDASISKLTKADEAAKEEPIEAEEELEDDSEEMEQENVVQVVNKIRNISFPELLTYFMRRL